MKNPFTKTPEGDANSKILEASIFMLESTLGGMSPSSADAIVAKAIQLLRLVK